MTDAMRQGCVFLVTCEHGGNRIPLPYRALFAGFEDVLNTHRGYDTGALLMARELARALGAKRVTSTTSRLLLDLNRSVGHPTHFSEATRGLPAVTRALLIEQHYLPYRQRVDKLVDAAIRQGQCVIHLSSHSFTPQLNGEVRRADVGLLYDPARAREATFCARWQAEIRAQAPALRVRRNYPYLGKGDGLTSSLRRRCPDSSYLGIELEINQAIVFAGGEPWQSLRRLLIESLRRIGSCSGQVGDKPDSDRAA
jgi:predicted N-formylglutamate amidohydrolase